MSSIRAGPSFFEYRGQATDSARDGVTRKGNAATVQTARFLRNGGLTFPELACGVSRPPGALMVAVAPKPLDANGEWPDGIPPHPLPPGQIRGNPALWRGSSLSASAIQDVVFNRHILKC